MHMHTFLVTLVVLLHYVAPTSSVLIQQKEHRTAAAAERTNDLRCYVCDSMETLYGQNCIHSPGNSKNFEKRCRDDARICMTKKFSYTTSTENTTSEARLFSMERNCTSKCEPGCIIIGERTKLYACTACCETQLCNTGSGQGGLRLSRLPLLLVLLHSLLQHSCATRAAARAG